MKLKIEIFNFCYSAKKLYRRRPRRIVLRDPSPGGPWAPLWDRRRVPETRIPSGFRSWDPMTMVPSHGTPLASQGESIPKVQFFDVGAVL